MGFFDHLKTEAKTQFIEIIQWLDESSDTLVYRFPVYNQEIKMGAQLTVRENQVALFINEGKAADLFTPGRYELTTQTIPILTALRGWKYGFASPFKAEVYFFNTRLFTDLKWGTTNPVMMRDKDFGMIRLRAFGTYAMRISDPKEFFRTVVGTQGLSPAAWGRPVEAWAAVQLQGRFRKLAGRAMRPIDYAGCSPFTRSGRRRCS